MDDDNSGNPVIRYSWITLVYPFLLCQSFQFRAKYSTWGYSILHFLFRVIHLYRKMSFHPRKDTWVVEIIAGSFVLRWRCMGWNPGNKYNKIIITSPTERVYWSFFACLSLSHAWVQQGVLKAHHTCSANSREAANHTAIGIFHFSTFFPQSTLK